MPELPEVETVRRTLQELVVGKTISHVSVFWPKMVKHPEELAQFQDALAGQTFQDIGRRGKFLILYTNEYALVSHLRMEGRYGLYAKEEPVEKHTHVIFHFTDDTELRYKDVRKFGTMHLYTKGKNLRHFRWPIWDRNHLQKNLRWKTLLLDFPGPPAMSKLRFSTRKRS